MSKIYTTWGSICGCCGHRHQTLQAAQKCLDRESRALKNGQYHDRNVYIADFDDPYIDGYHTQSHPGELFDLCGTDE